jgi:hypothetical protein
VLCHPCYNADTELKAAVEALEGFHFAEGAEAMRDAEDMYP